MATASSSPSLHLYVCKSMTQHDQPVAARSSTVASSATAPRPAAPASLRIPRPTTTSSVAHEQQRREYLHHLAAWATNHDSSPHFHGRIFVLGRVESAQAIRLGESVRCLVTHAAHAKSDASTGNQTIITIRLFAPRKTAGRYKMVVRNGGGWISAFDFFNKESRGYHSTQPRRLPALMLDLKDSIAVQPLFHPFLRLPLELQQVILTASAGLTRSYRPGRDHEVDSVSSASATASSIPLPLATLFKICSAWNQHLVPMIYSTTDFHFGQTGFTKFLWQCGPVNRARVKRLTFQFSQSALLHCIRWLAPDAVFQLFQPRVYTHPHALQYVWRCQIQDLSRELHLAVLTFDLHNIPAEEIPMAVRILRALFGSVDHVRFTDAGSTVSEDDDRLAGLREQQSWRDMCKTYFERHRHESTYMARERRLKNMEKLEQDMNRNRHFFDDADLCSEIDPSTGAP